LVQDRYNREFVASSGSEMLEHTFYSHAMEGLTLELRFIVMGAYRVVGCSRRVVVVLGALIVFFISRR